MELIDGDGKRWRVLGLRKIGRARSLLPWIFWALLAGPTYRIEQTLEVLEPVTLAEVKEMTLRSMEATAQDWGPEDQRDLHFDPQVKRVKAAKSVEEIFVHLGLDSFIGY